MKAGTISSSLERPMPGFELNREGCSIYIHYIENIKELDNTVTDDGLQLDKYEFTSYSSTVIISTYDDLIKAMVALKYDIEDEIALINNYMEAPTDEMIKNEYLSYRSYVTECKTVAKDNYERLRLTKNN